MNPNNIDIPLPRVSPLRRTGRQNNNRVDLQGIQNPLGINANENQQVNLFNIPLQANNNADLQGIQTPPRVNANQNQQMNFFNTPPQEPRNRNHLLNAPEAIHARNFRDARFNNVFIPDEERLINEEANPRVIGNILEQINGQNNFPHPLQLGGINNLTPREVGDQLIQAIQNNQMLANDLNDNYVQILTNNGVRCGISNSNIIQLRQDDANIVLLMQPDQIYLNLSDADFLIAWINRCVGNRLPITNPYGTLQLVVGNIVNPGQVDPLNIR